MTPDHYTDAVKQARAKLAEIKVVRDDTDNRVMTAYRLGIHKSEIFRLSGLARSTVDRILGHKPRYARPGHPASLPPSDRGGSSTGVGPG